MKKCWICRRTEEEVIKEFRRQCNANPDFDVGMICDGETFIETRSYPFFADDKEQVTTQLCVICEQLIYSLAYNMAEGKIEDWIESGSFYEELQKAFVKATMRITIGELKME